MPAGATDPRAAPAARPEIRRTDVIVIGGGLAGLCAALALAAKGLTALCVERRAPPATPLGGDPAAAAADNRTAAILQPGLDFLDAIGVWERAAPWATPLRTMRMIDVDRGGARPRKSAPFDAGDIGAGAFGANIANEALRRLLLEQAAAHPLIDLRAPAAITRLVRRDDAAHATLDDGTQHQAALAIAADGRDSAARAAAGVRVRRLDYGQSAVVAMMAHAQPHQNVSTEIHRTGGPFTLAPYLDGPSGEHRSSLVWLERNAAVDALMRADDDVFAARATERSLGVLGPLRPTGPRRRFKVISLLADTLRAKRLALVAEAAHVAPPTGAQGLNMSLRDAEALAETLADAQAAGRDIGADATLRLYERRRWPDIAARVLGTAALNTAAIGAAQPVRDLRALTLSALYDLPAMRKAAIRLGLGA